MEAQTGAPPPPGADSPVPADAAARAAAAGRARRAPTPSAPQRDALVPATAIESRAQARARERRERLAAGFAPQPIANPGAGMGGAQLAPPGSLPAVAEAMPQRLAYAAYPHAAHPHAPYPHAPHPYAPYPYAAHAYAPHPYAPNPYAPSPYAVHPAALHASAPYGVQPVPPPRVPWSRRQRSAALLSAWLGQTVMALATHLLTAFAIVVGFAFLLHASGEPVGAIEADSFTAVIARWTMPDRVWATTLIGVLVGGALLAAGWLLQALWSKAAGLARPHRSAWLAWLCTTAATGLIGVVVWPFALVLGLVAALMDASASLTTGTMWATLFWELGAAVVLTGGVGLLFGWLFLSQARPRVDDPAIVAAAEAAARARDEAELAAVQLRFAPSEAPTSRAPGRGEPTDGR